MRPGPESVARRVNIFPAARLRLLEIWDYTETEWGEAQADDYVGGLIRAMNSLITREQPWRRVPVRTMPGTWFVKYRQHFIFFRELSSGELGIISILHSSMDIPRQLRKDAL